MPLDLDQFQTQFGRFKEVIAYNDKGRPFVSFNEGVAAIWEDYPPHRPRWRCRLPRHPCCRNERRRGTTPPRRRASTRISLPFGQL